MSLHLRWRIAIPYIFLIIAVMTSTAIYLSFRFSQQSLADLEAKLESETSLLAENLASYKGDFSIHNEDFNKFANTWADILDARITIIAPDGVVIGESDANIFSMENHLERPEIQQALATGFGRSTRYSQTEGREFLYTAVPISGIGEIKGFVRIAITTEQIQSETALFIRPIIFITIVALILAIIFAAVIAEYLSRPIHQLTWAVKRVAVEDLQLSPILSPRDELGQLANAFEAVVSELVTQIKTYELEQRKLEAVLKQLADGVVIVDDIGTIQVINPAAQKIFNIEGIDVIGQSLAIVTRHHDIVNLWKTTHQSKKGEITSIEISTGRIVLQASGIPLADLLPGSSLLVFHDVTRVRHLETVRRDFISNISHELRTPLASLKALTETLQDGALEDENVAMHFLNQMEI
jgi:two-component system phosphate regulon sensor histidine kinase PhoR